MAKVFKFLTPPACSSCPSCCSCATTLAVVVVVVGAEKLKTMRIPLAALLRLEWTYFSLPSPSLSPSPSPSFIFFCIIKKVLYIFCWYSRAGWQRGGVGVYLHLAVGCVKRLALPWPGRAWSGRGWSKNLRLVLKFLILCYLAAQTICCHWEYPKREGERVRER